MGILFGCTNIKEYFIKLGILASICVITCIFSKEARVEIKNAFLNL
jgi:hypothetical protein